MLICSWRIWTTLLLTTGKDGSLALRKYLLSQSQCQRAARSCHAGNAQLAQGAQAAVICSWWHMPFHVPVSMWLIEPCESAIWLQAEHHQVSNAQQILDISTCI